MPSNIITKEVYKIGSNGKREYAGVARFDSSGKFLGTSGGGRNGSNIVQNTIRTAGARGAARNPAMRIR